MYYKGPFYMLKKKRNTYFKREAAIDVLLSPLTSFILVSRMNDLFVQSTHLQYIQILMSFALGCLQLCSLESTTLLTLPNLTVSETQLKKGQQPLHAYCISNFAASWVELLHMISNDSNWLQIRVSTGRDVPLSRDKKKFLSRCPFVPGQGQEQMSRDKKKFLSLCPFVPGQGQEQKSEDLLFLF